MKRFFIDPLADEFVVDELPEPVLLSHEENGNDLLGLISNVMLDNERLQDLTLQLERHSSQTQEVEKIIRSLLPTLDSFDRLLNLARSFPPGEEIDNWLKSIESVYFRLLTLLEGYGLYQLKTVGKKVDLNLHEVVEYLPSQDHPNDIVTGERQKGYVFRGKLLRDAKVVVAYSERSNSRP